MLTKLYLGLGGLMICWYSLSALAGWEYGAARRVVVPADQRAKGGVRTWGYVWAHSHYYGGK